MSIIFALQIVTFILTKWFINNKTIYEIVYWFLILSTAISGGLFFVFEIVAYVKWGNIKSITQLVEWNFESMFTPIIGFIYSFTMIILSNMFLRDYIKYKKGNNSLNATPYGYNLI